MIFDDRHAISLRIVRISTAILLAALLSIPLCRFAIEFSPSRMEDWGAIQLLDAIAACSQDLLLLGLLAGMHWLANRPLPQGKTIAAIFFAALYAIFTLVGVANVITLHAVGSPADVSWLGFVNMQDRGTALVAVLAILTPNVRYFLALAAISLPALPVLVSIWRPVSLGFLAGLALSCAAATAALGYVGPAAQAHISRASLTINPIVLFAEQNFLTPGPIRAVFDGAPAPQPFDNSDWAVRPARFGTHACCRGMNLLFITIDTVPLKRANRELIFAHADRFPNLAWLYRHGLFYDHFYSAFPRSPESLGVLMASVYPNTSLYISDPEVMADRDLPILSSVLAASGYQAAHFMSGELRFAGSDRFLAGRGFTAMDDSTTLRCGPNDEAIFAAYSSLGDDCTARAAAAWIGKPRHAPFFLWTWFSNPHYPYYAPRLGAALSHQRTPEAHAEALSATDAALGTILDALRKSGQFDRTIIAVTADHGEAFGEHGLFEHGGSVHDEQVRVPLVLVAPALPHDAVDSTLGGAVDLAPTLVDLLGLRIPAGWQGESLFDPQRRRRVYFMSASGGQSVGYREGDEKFIVSTLEDRPFYYDLKRDPLELNPLQLSPGRQEQVEARLGAFIRYRNGLHWRARAAGGVTTIAARAIR